MRIKRRTNPDSEANIRRIDSKPSAKKQTHGFQVHLLRGRQAVSKMFSDRIYGGKEGARRAARKFKRTTMADLPQRMFSGPSAAKKTSAKGKAPSAATSARGKPAAKRSASKKR